MEARLKGETEGSVSRSLKGRYDDPELKPCRTEQTAENKQATRSRSGS